MPAPRSADIVESARVAVETTTRPLDDIAAEAEVTVKTLRNWITKHGWQRPPGAPARVLKIPPAKLGPVRRIYESGGTVVDLAIVLGCDVSYVRHCARQRQWNRRTVPAETPPAGDEVLAMEAALRDPGASRPDLIRLMERAVVVTAADALATGNARGERRTLMLGKLAALLKNLPEDAVAAPGLKESDVDAGDEFPDADDLVEEIARRFEAFSEEWIDPRILAAVAAAVP